MKKNVIVGQSGGPTAVINASLAGVYKTAKDMGADTIYGMRYGIQGLLEKKIVDLGEKIRNDMDVELLKRTPASFLGSCRYKLPEISEDKAIYEKIFAILEELEITAFFYIGGNDSMDTIKKLSDYAQTVDSPIRFIGVPKTIDNDLEGTDHTPGYGSAAKYIATVTKELVRDGLIYEMQSVTVIEIMGRNAGWLTGAAVLAKSEDCEGPDLIYLPERDFSMDQFLDDVIAVYKRKGECLIAVSEGVHYADGRFVSEAKTAATDGFGHAQLGGLAATLAGIMKERTGAKVRGIELSLLQRCAAHCASGTDIEEAFMSGKTAVEQMVAGQTDKMVGFECDRTNGYTCKAKLFELSDVANFEKKFPAEWITPEGNNVTEDFIKYAMPLIQGETKLEKVNGLPRFARLKKVFAK